MSELPNDTFDKANCTVYIVNWQDTGTRQKLWHIFFLFKYFFTLVISSTELKTNRMNENWHVGVIAYWRLPFWTVSLWLRLYTLLGKSSTINLSNGIRGWIDRSSCTFLFSLPLSVSSGPGWRRTGASNSIRRVEDWNLCRISICQSQAVPHSSIP